MVKLKTIIDYNNTLIKAQLNCIATVSDRYSYIVVLIIVYLLRWVILEIVLLSKGLKIPEPSKPPLYVLVQIITLSCTLHSHQMQVVKVVVLYANC